MIKSPAQSAGEQSTPVVRLHNLSKVFGSTTAVHPHDFDIEEGEFLALLGPSGCGKTTLLRMIGGFLEPTTGSIEVSGEDVTRLGPDKRRTNMVFQGYGLFPHMNVRSNIAYGLVLKGTPKKEITYQVERMLSLVHLEGFEDRFPSALSGGQAQRVALARALIMSPAVLLLDESLAALDLKLRKAMQDELRNIHKMIGGTFVFVTHDQSEAMALATRIAVMQGGRIVQEGTPQEIYKHPGNEFVAGFIGEANIIRASRCRGDILVPGIPPLGNLEGPDGDVSVVVRPDAIRFLLPNEKSDFRVTGTITDQIYFGTHITFTLNLANSQKFAVILPLFAGQPVPKQDEIVTVGWSAAGCTLVPAA